MTLHYLFMSIGSAVMSSFFSEVSSLYFLFLDWSCQEFIKFIDILKEQILTLLIFYFCLFMWAFFSVKKCLFLFLTLSGLSCGTWDLLLWLLGFSLVVVHELSFPVTCGSLVSWLGIKPVFPALEGRLSTTGPPGKSWAYCFFQYMFSLLLVSFHIFILFLTSWDGNLEIDF